MCRRLVAGWWLVVWLVFCSLFAKSQKTVVKPRKLINTNKNGPETVVSGPEIGCGGWI